MRKIWILTAVLALVCLSCHNQAPERVTVELSLKNIPDQVKRAYLQQMQPTALLTVDTAAVDPLGGAISFSFAPSASEGLYRVHLDDSTDFLLVLGKENVTISGDYRHPGAWVAAGSEATGELQQFLSRLNEDNQELYRRRNRYDDLRKADAGDSLVRAALTAVNRQKAQILNTILEEARTTQNPVTAVFALSTLDDSASWEKGKAVFNGLPQRFPDNVLVKQAVEAYSRQLNNQGLSAKVGIGDLAPDIRLPDTSGREFALRALRGKYVLIDFWASWCAPCREASPQLVKAFKRFEGRNFTILGVSLDSKRSSWEKAIREDKLYWHQVSDLKGWNSGPAAIYGVEAIPANFLIDPDGKIVARDLAGDSLVATLRRILPPQ